MLRFQSAHHVHEIFEAQLCSSFSLDLGNREKLGVVTRAFFAQRDFTSTDILVDFYSSLQSSMRGKVSESTMHMGQFQLRQSRRTRR